MKIAVIGGGASGIAAAIFLQRTVGNRVTVFERSDRILKKLLATGNGRCNLSNTFITENNYFSHTPEALNKILPAFTPEEERQFFESLGIILCEENGRLYPYSRRANSVSDALRFECEHLGVEIRTNSFINRIAKKDDGFTLMGEFFDRVIISAGGFSAPSFGTDGNAFNLLKSLGHTITPTSYALAPIKVKEGIKALKGIRVQATVSLFEKDKLLRSEKGELQLTDYGLSGIAIMQLSRLCKENMTVKADLMNDFSHTELLSFLKERKKVLAHLKAEDFLSGFLHKALGQYILKQCGINPSLPSGKLTENNIAALAVNLKELPFTVSSVLGKEQSQATSGGACLTEFDLSTLESLKVPNLYCIGEALDCVGDCGGYNLHWAWTTAYIVGRGMK